MFNQNLLFHLLLIFKRLKIDFHNYLLKEITKYLPTHCGALLTSDMTYSLFYNNFLCKNTPIYYRNLIFDSYVNEDKIGIETKLWEVLQPQFNHNNPRKKLVQQNLFITLCENHKNIVTIPNINSTYDNINESMYADYYPLLYSNYKNQKIDFLINQKKKIKRKLSKNEESNNKKRKLN